MKRKLFFSTSMLPLLLLLLSTSCQKEARTESAQKNAPSSASNTTTAEQGKAPGSTIAHIAESELLKSVRKATARFHSTTQAINAGYMPNDHCVSSPLGGMGYHWANPTMIDGMFDPENPEVLLYAKGPGGNLRLVAVEYVVMNTGQARPMFGGQLFDIGGAPVPGPHWTLHVWVHESNPSGMYKPFNPNITCQ